MLAMCHLANTNNILTYSHFGGFSLIYQVYNCAKMPSICANVARRNPMVNGIIVGGPISLTYDTDTHRRDDRRDQQCPDNWKSHHPCPEQNLALPVVPAGSWVGRPGNDVIVGARRLDPFLPAKEPGSYVVSLTVFSFCSLGKSSNSIDTW